MSIFSSCAELIDHVLNSGKISQSQATRLRVIRSIFFDKQSRSQTSRNCAVSLPFVDRWKKRWLNSQSQRQDWFDAANQANRTLRADIDFLFSLVADAARSGPPPKFDEATKAHIIAIALTKPSEHGLPIEKWSQQILADYLIEQGIVDYICSSTVSNFLKSAPATSSS